MFHDNVPRLFQIRNRPRYLQNPVVRPGAQTLLLHGPLQQPLGVGVQFAVHPDLLRSHLRVCVNLPRSCSGRPAGAVSNLCKSLPLTFPCPQDPGSNLGRALGRAPSAKLLVLDRRNLDMNVDPIETFETYLWIIGGVHMHSRDLSLK